MNELKVSIVLPCYNQIKYVKESIDSVLNQSYDNFELILVDNASTDGTKEVLAEYAKKDKRVTCIFHNKNLGFTKSINDGFEIASGKLIAIHNSDDVWYPNKLEEQVKVFKEFSDVDVVTADAEIIDENGKSVGYSFSQELNWNTFGVVDFAFNELCKRNFCCHPSIIFRKNCLSTAKGYDESLSYACDWWFLLILSKKHKFYYLNSKLLKYRIHPNNLTKNKNNTYKDMMEIRRRLAEDLGVDKSINLAKASFYAAMLGDHTHAKSFASEAMKGRLPVKYKLLLSVIQNSDHSGDLLSKLNVLRHLSNEAVRKIF